MSFARFLTDLLTDGTARLTGRPAASAAGRAEAHALLAAFYADYRLTVAGPLLPFDAAAALAAGELVWHGCWFLVSRDEPEDELDRRLTMPSGLAPAAAHLSADLVLRFVPALHRRARAVAPDDRLTTILAATLQRWPLSGVLADLAEGPLASVDFDGHAGLQMLYAERLAGRDKPAWLPEGPAREIVEWVAEGKRGTR